MLPPATLQLFPIQLHEDRPYLRGLLSEHLGRHGEQFRLEAIDVELQELDGPCIGRELRMQNRCGEFVEGTRFFRSSQLFPHSEVYLTA